MFFIVPLDYLSIFSRIKAIKKIGKKEGQMQYVLKVLCIQYKFNDICLLEGLCVVLFENLSNLRKILRLVSHNF